jgi:hypothetical protein
MQISLQGDILAVCMVEIHIHILLFQCGSSTDTNLLFWPNQRGEEFSGLLH